MKCSPVLMMGFNRPEMTRDLLACVRRAAPAKLYFAVDGPRPNKGGEAQSVAQTQAVAEEVDWPCEVKTLFRDENRGCAYAIPEAISWFLSQEPYGIILEDDVRPSDGFFMYETELLERYKDDPCVGMVSGFNHYGFQTDRTATYHFTNRADIWGWGTWARVWKDYSLDISSYLPQLESILSRFTRNRRMRNMIRSYVNGVVRNPNTWDVQFALMFMAKGYLSAAPRKRLTANLGFGDGRGVHTCGYCYDAVHYLDRWDGDVEIAHPTSVAIDARAVALTECRMCGILPRGLTVVGLKIPESVSCISGIGKMLEFVWPCLFRL